MIPAGWIWKTAKCSILSMFHKYFYKVKLHKVDYDSSAALQEGGHNYSQSPSMAPVPAQRKKRISRCSSEIQSQTLPRAPRSEPQSYTLPRPPKSSYNSGISARSTSCLTHTGLELPPPRPQQQDQRYDVHSRSVGDLSYYTMTSLPPDSSTSSARSSTSSASYTMTSDHSITDDSGCCLHCRGPVDQNHNCLAGVSPKHNSDEYHQLALLFKVATTRSVRMDLAHQSLDASAAHSFMQLTLVV